MYVYTKCPFYRSPVHDTFMAYSLHLRHPVIVAVLSYVSDIMHRYLCVRIFVHMYVHV